MERDSIETAKVTLRDGWRGKVVIRDAQGERFSIDQWQTILAEPAKLVDAAERTIKSIGPNRVVVKEMGTKDKRVRAVIKRHHRGGGVREFFRSMGRPRAVRNFDMAVKTAGLGICGAAALAAVYHRGVMLCRESIYISEYVDGLSLYGFLKNLPAEGKERIEIARRLAERIAGVFADLHKNGLWHRDAKATNFIVSRRNPGDYEVVPADMDGIKPYFIRSQKKQMRALWQLGASVMNLPNIRRTDYLRLFKAYCEKAGIPKEKHRQLRNLLAKKTVEKYRQNVRKWEV